MVNPNIQQHNKILPVAGDIMHLQPLISFLYSASEWKVPTTFIYGFEDWMNYQGAQEARKQMKVPCEIIRVPQVSLSLSLEKNK